MEKHWMTLGRLVSLLSQNLTNLTNRKCGADTSLDTAWRAVSESLKSILTGVPQSMLDRLALVETLAHKIRSRIQIRLPSLLSGLQGKSQIVQDELLRLAESMVSNSEGTKALALELSHEFEDKFFQHIMTGEMRCALHLISTVQGKHVLGNLNGDGMERHTQ